ncbi:MAG: CxxxxCH/CxxCH domain-containing protein [Holophagaceae bacterium]|uniref:CxxxxCH/CxxCH domain-containing protein n=1 Tax=Candidatus Geothrix skivensis TaxID=2954439 RepID=A0A9D7SHL0_9BACT|nr:CxxxxCH/CxxCH domain-containing protein [Candidatus Geothrix skivensis]
MNKARRWNGSTGLLGLLLVAISILGCGGGKGASGTAQSFSNYHPVGWVNAHAAPAVAGVEACTKCHAISLLQVGSGVPTCLTTGCHHQATPGFAGPGIHGLRAKLAVNATTGGSLASCQICHAKDFSGGASVNACATCHGVKAPHPAAPWRTSGGTSYSHTSTDTSNAAICAQCHYPGSPNNPAGHPAAPAPAGTQPGCYNATLCHGAAGSAPHALGAIWKDPTSAAFHGIEAKKDLKYCQSCHGTPGTTKFDGGSASTACSSCHSKTSGAGAHSTTWYKASAVTFPGYVPSHRNATDPLNANGSCVICHAVTKTGTSALTTAPSCYTASFGNSEHAAVSCHANGPGVAPHLVGATWTDPLNAGTTDATFHGIEAKKDLLYCQTCHGVPGTNKFDGGTSTTTCSSCHTQAKAHADVWSKSGSSFSSGSYVASHRNAADAISLTKRAAVCGLCHVTTAGGGTPPMVGAPGCFTASYNAVGCHVNGPGAAAHPSPFLSGMTTSSGTGNTHQNVTAAQFAGECINCHDETGAGTSKVGPSCTQCHVSSSPLAAGKGPGTCLSCHPDPNFQTKGPAGTTFPNIAGAHAKHMNLLTPLDCATCHTGSLPGQGGANQPHYTGANRGPNGTPTGTGPAPVTMNPLYKAQTGTLGTNPSLSAFTCNAVSCHGGQTTPGWQSGKLTFNATTYCLSCHKIASTATQYNDATGRHNNPNDHNQTCNYCHDMNPATNNKSGVVNHFKYLNTTAVRVSPDQLSSDTIKFGGGSQPATGALTYTVNATIGRGGCALSCHGTTHTTNNNTWN